jgi:hypothetical protein
MSGAYLQPPIYEEAFSTNLEKKPFRAKAKPDLAEVINEINLEKVKW